MTDSDLRARIELVMQLRQVERERDYLLAERTRMLAAHCNMVEVLLTIRNDDSTPMLYRDMIDELRISLA